ncbi:hypothetical protein [Nonomuraea sp. NPDC049028]|uniref:hypothetical protein n=1 Tax=Nonomuraea sp. NPDC049028 TaxID=3364348 RepID=UPI003710715D
MRSASASGGELCGCEVGLGDRGVGPLGGPFRAVRQGAQRDYGERHERAGAREAQGGEYAPHHEAPPEDQAGRSLGNVHGHRDGQLGRQPYQGGRWSERSR